MAIHTNNPLFAYMARKIEGLPDFESSVLPRSLLAFRENAELQKELPVLKNIPHYFEKFFTTSGLARIRHEDTLITIFGGNDKHVQIISAHLYLLPSLTFIP